MLDVGQARRMLHNRKVMGVCEEECSRGDPVSQTKVEMKVKKLQNDKGDVGYGWLPVGYMNLVQTERSVVGKWRMGGKLRVVV